jgi:hypothetical protein
MRKQRQKNNRIRANEQTNKKKEGRIGKEMKNEGKEREVTLVSSGEGTRIFSKNLQRSMTVFTNA